MTGRLHGPAPDIPFDGNLSSANVDHDAAVNAVTVPRVLTKKRCRTVIGARPEKSIVSAQSPAAGVPLDAPAHISRQKRRCVVDPEAGLFEQTHSANTATDIRHDRTPSRD